MRERFEKLPEISERLHTVVYNEEFNQYHAAMINSGLSVKYIQGAWYAYQEQQKKIDFLNMKLEATKCVSSKRREEVLCRDSKINAAKKEINDFFDNQTMTPSPREYANKLADVLELLK